jgi:chromosomal replication initiation ATPase DnaA
LTASEDKPKKSRQLKLDFPESVLTLETLSVTACNRTAIATLKRWPDWRMPALALVGGPKSGLTTAAAAWTEHAGGVLLSAKAFDKLSHKKLEKLASQPFAIDVAQDVRNEDNLLSAINLTARAGGSLLLTGNTAPAQWRVKLPDLASRLKSMTLVELAPPDDEMVSIRLKRAMKRRYLKLPSEVETYLLARIERSYIAIETFVENLHEMIDGREVTVPLSREVLDEMDGTRPLFEDEDD